MPDTSRSLLERFPSLRRLIPKAPRKRLPYIQQLSATECGAACLAMLLNYHGREVRLDEVRDVMGLSRDGASLAGILAAASHFRMRGRAARLELGDLQYLPPGSILHWEFQHFILFERLDGEWVDVVDPGVGRRRIALAQFSRSFTGIALLLEPGESFEKARSDERPLRRYAYKLLVQSGLLARILVASLLVQLFALGLPALTGVLVDKVVPRGDVQLLWILSAAMASVMLFYLLSSLTRSFFLVAMRVELDAQMTLSFLEHLLDLPYAFFQRRSSGDLMNRLSSNSAVRELLTTGLLSSVLDGVMSLLCLVILAFISIPIFLLVLGLTLVQVMIFVATRRQQYELMAQNLEAEARSRTFQIEMLAGIETLKAMGVEYRAAERWSGMLVDVLNVALKRGHLNALTESLQATLRLGSPLVVLCFGAAQVLGGQFSLGTLMALSALSAGFFIPLSNLLSTSAQVQVLNGYLERINDVMQAEPEQAADSCSPVGVLQGGISFEKVSFRYASNGPLVLQDLDLVVKPGQLVAIVGRTGAGKSTLASLLLGLYSPSEGLIRFDGRDLREVDLRSVRRQVGIVMQNAYIFGGSLRANIALADPELPLDDIIEAAKLAQIHDEIMAMPMGYDTPLVDRGASLSGGQRQRLALARALVRKPSILLLDEATSALDAITEQRVQASLAALNCTRIVIAHRLSTVVGADLIITLDKGRIVEMGTHRELLSQGSHYNALVAAQLR
ncbi:peptidase domain-containing ABC transporter [Corallococcus praedator]|uniref:Peptidase domain-containing ABC transporter n=1 Tax=Corallococcus praedator TaxID=2316724 RepID=A0ABX9QRZ0_9BACT|nr:MULTISPECIES: peptidase domain-containing ABC transporter [Corallococcus]RKH35262.1 peptidase domain-containing ABC transporter [Corallococcus sp. CA031C]RKI16407.1 peptidase domain-containing ABC transporter [Corallococcus praedator]